MIFIAASSRLFRIWASSELLRRSAWAYISSLVGFPVSSPWRWPRRGFTLFYVNDRTRLSPAMRRTKGYYNKIMCRI